VQRKIAVWIPVLLVSQDKCVLYLTPWSFKDVKRFIYLDFLKDAPYFSFPELCRQFCVYTYTYIYVYAYIHMYK